MKTREKVLYGILIFVAINTLINYIIFLIKSDYPKEMFIALIPPTVTEFFIIWRLGVGEKDNGKNI